MLSTARRPSLGLSLLGVALAAFSTLGANEAAAQSAPDLENTIVLEIGLGYDSPTDQTPRRQGRVTIELTPEYAPAHAERLRTLTRAGWYDGKSFHRVMDGFLAQTGSPDGVTRGGAEGFPNLQLELSDVKFERGVVGMARGVQKDSANSQFFIALSRFESWDDYYTVIGRVVSGMDVIDSLHRTHKRKRKLPGAPDRIISAKVAADIPQ